MDPSNPRIIPLPRPVADELVVCAALAPLAVADLAAAWDPLVYATDSSDDAAAIVSAQAPAAITPLLWRSADRKGASTKLLSRAQAILHKADPSFEEGIESGTPRGPLDFSAPTPEPSVTVCPRPVGFHFHFLQIGGVNSYISTAIALRGWSVGPLLDSTFSPHYDLCDDVFFRWLLHLLEAGKLDSLLLSVPVPSFLRRLGRPFAHSGGPLAWPLAQGCSEKTVSCSGPFSFSALPASLDYHACAYSPETAWPLPFSLGLYLLLSPALCS